MPRALLFTIRLHDGRWHGVPEWPPAPARLFQALVAGAAEGGTLPPAARAVLQALEALPPPQIAAPAMLHPRGHTTFVPNNDLDAVGGDPDRIGEIRAGKTIRPRLLDAALPFLYLWALHENAAPDPAELSALAQKLYQFGRGVDMAFAEAEVLSEEEANARFDAHPGSKHLPGGTGGNALAIPVEGSLRSLVDRQRAQIGRFTLSGTGKKAQTIFTQPPKPFFGQAFYNSPPRLLLFDLAGPQAPWPLERAAKLVETLRDAAAQRLTKALPDKAATIDRVFGRSRDLDESAKGQRLQIIPLPSIGTTYTAPRIRRVLVQMPQNMPLPRADAEWAFSSLGAGDADGVGAISLLETLEQTMLAHYGIGAKTPSRLWRSITPLALPLSAARRRIDPARRSAEAKGGGERASEEAIAMAAVRSALRHADITHVPAHIRVQREAFGRKGAGAEDFAQGTRFGKHSLWHAEIGFAIPIPGPLLLGDGRYLGLGLLHPVRAEAAGGEGIVSFTIVDGLLPGADPLALASALRRALITRVQKQEHYKTGEMPFFFHGHGADGSAHRPGGHGHVAVVADVPGARLHIFAPHVLERRGFYKGERDWCKILDTACHALAELRAGPAGRLQLAPAIGDAAPLLAVSRHWTSLTPYAVTRHRDAGSAHLAVIADVEAEIARLRLPRPRVTVRAARSGPGGLAASVSLEFAAAVAGPIIIGRSRHKGGGVFVPESKVAASGS